MVTQRLRALGKKPRGRTERRGEAREKKKLQKGGRPATEEEKVAGHPKLRLLGFSFERI